nr:MAG TPA: PWWP domain-containing protein [Caudoviricetes sp.]
MVQCPRPPNFSSFPFPSGAGFPTRPHLCPCSSTGERPTHPGDVVWCKPRPGL